MTPSADETGRQEAAAAQLEAEKRIQAAIITEVQKQLDRERSVLKDTGALAAKLVLGALGLLLAMFTLFGLSTWKDVKRETAEHVKSRVEELIQRSDSETSVKQTLNDLVNRSIVGSALIQLKRGASKNLDLPKNEWDRLRAWLKLESLGVQEFSDVLAVLDAQSEGRKKTDANEYLSEMLSPAADSPYKWMRKQPEKRIALMANFKHLDIGASATEIAVSSNASQDLRVASVGFVKAVRYPEAFDKFIELAPQLDDGPLKREMFIACAALRPSHARLEAELTKLTANSGAESLQTAARVVLELWSAENRHYRTSDAEKQISITSRRLLAYVFEHGADIQFDDRASRPFLDTREGSSRTLPKPGVVLWVPTSTSTRSGVPVTFEQLKAFTPYWEIVDEAANKGDLKRLQTLLPRGDFAFRGVAAPGVRITLKPTSKVIVVDEHKDKRELTGENTADFFITSARRSGGLPVVWVDNKGFRSTGTLADISGSGFASSLSETLPRETVGTAEARSL